MCKTITAKHYGRAPATAETSSNYGMGRFGKSVQSFTAIKEKIYESSDAIKIGKLEFMLTSRDNLPRIYQ